MLAFDPDAAATASGRRSLPAELADRIAYQVAAGSESEIEPGFVRPRCLLVVALI